MSGNNNQPRFGKSSATTTDAAGNVYLAGRLIGEIVFGNIRLVSMGYNDMFVAKWSPTTTSWAWAFAETTRSTIGNTEARSIVVSGNNVYVTGNFDSGANLQIAGQALPGAGRRDIFLAKYTDNGTSARQTVGGAGDTDVFLAKYTDNGSSFSNG